MDIYDARTVQFMERCNSCQNISSCPVCGSNISRFHHTGVRGNRKYIQIPLIDTSLTYEDNPSGIRHYAIPCGHRILTQGTGVDLEYNGGPLWKSGYSWYNIFWGNFFTGGEQREWMARVNKATADIESSRSYSGGLSQYNVGMGKFGGSRVIDSNPPQTVRNSEIEATLVAWIGNGTVPDLKEQGAYNIFMPPGVTVLLYGEASCVSFCDYHDSVDGSRGPFYTVEPFPCSSGCNNCTTDAFETLTSGLSEEMVELKTDMEPGKGWVIGNEEICDYCDGRYVCNRISTGEYVNAWYDRATGACWKGMEG